MPFAIIATMNNTQRGAPLVTNLSVILENYYYIKMKNEVGDHVVCSSSSNCGNNDIAPCNLV
jgi:hypothetical protein